RRVASSADALRLDHGTDLRGTPPLPCRTPRIVWVVVGGLLAWGLFAGAVWTAYPTGWREFWHYGPYTIHLVGMLGLWLALFCCMFVGILVPIEYLNRWLRGMRDTDRRGLQVAAVVGYAVLVSWVAMSVPPLAILVACLVLAAGAWVAYLPKGRDEAAVVWRASEESPVCSIPIHRMLAVVTALAALFVFDVLLSACGGRLFAPLTLSAAMSLTTLFGVVAAWLMPGLVVVLLAYLVSSRRGDPARRTPPTAHVAGADPVEVRRAANVIRSWGWKVQSAPRLREAGTVGIELVTPEKSEATEFDPRWPLKVSLADLEAGSVRERLARRDEIGVRRQLFTGLSKLFKRAAMFKGPGGGGLWFAPHWWFMDGMTREEADESEDAPPTLVGPSYSRVLPPRSRQHAHAVLRATQVDMIFVEDGVSYRKVEKVLRVMTELYDVHGGKRRAEEQHFQGLPKVRVMIHDYAPGNPFRSDTYPEPQFADLSRVRVLHVFRDRGGEEEEVEPPYDFSWTPAPAGAFE
ncbi:MAG TPA: hypothetical protein VMZ71_17710, partial [Gemmataceae bacterium]|nr:hypothetical protein [Gemmataceae bacterium]